MDDSISAELMLAEQFRRLGVIVEFSRLALLEVAGDSDKTELVKGKAYRLLAEFEQSVLLDGKDPDIMAAIATARRDLDN